MLGPLVKRVGALIAPEVIFRFRCREKLIALTIDDGPDPNTTPHILDVLAKHDSQATFFIVGERGITHPQLLEEIVAAGHELGNHSFQERPTASLTFHEQETSILSTHQLLSDFGPIDWFRPGSGSYNSATLDIIKPLNYGIALADLYSFDHAIHSSVFHSRYVNRLAQPGSIIILHDVAKRGIVTAHTLDLLLPRLKTRGFRVLTLSQLAQHPSCTDIALPFEH